MQDQSTTSYRVHTLVCSWLLERPTVTRPAPVGRKFLGACHGANPFDERAFTPLSSSYRFSMMLIMHYLYIFFVLKYIIISVFDY